MLALWNNGCNRRLCHVLPANQDPDTERPRVVLMFVKWLVNHLLHVDSSPTLSRFFTFRGCTDRMLTMVLLGVPSHAFKLQKAKPRKESQKRLKNVHSFFKHAEADQLLRRTSLPFQLTGGVEALVSSLYKAGEPPPMVRLCRNEATTLVQDRLRKMLGGIAASNDPSLDVAATVNTVLAVSMELVVRMRRFARYPAALCNAK